MGNALRAHTNPYTHLAGLIEVDIVLKVFLENLR
jgi:hypothetical protein